MYMFRVYGGMMTQEERNRIVSEEYADLYFGEFLLEGMDISDYTLQYLNDFYGVMHVPVEVITNNIIRERSYASLPLLYGMISEASIEVSGITRLRNIPNFNLRGQGVLLGIVDTGIDYTNPIFQYEDGTTRIQSIWDQTIQSDNLPSGFNYGTEFTSEQINEALKNSNPYEIVPSKDEVGHGTMIAGVAAGKEVSEDGFYGVATDAEIVVVKLKTAKKYLKEFFRMPEDIICYQENDIQIGIEYLIRTAYVLNKPIAICIALGTSQGPHTGWGEFSTNLSYQAEYSGVAIVVAAGNEGNSRRHYYGVIDRKMGYDTVEMNVGQEERGFSMELWGNAPNLYTVDILTPSGEFIPKIAVQLDESREISFIFEPTVINIDYQMVEYANQLILFRFTDPEPGIWKFNVYGEGEFEQRFHIWLPMGDFVTKETFFIRSNPYTTILSVGNAILPITVTAYNGVDDSLYLGASRGYTKSDIVKPEIAAPGVDVVGPTLDGGFANVTGTCVSAAHTAGVAAMLLEWGIVKGNLPNMNTVDMKSFMIRGARREEDMIYPNRDWGYGILDVFNIYNRLRREL